MNTHIKSTVQTSAKAKPRFTSPNSPLSPKKLNKLQHCIEQSNDLLRTLGNPRQADNRRQLQLRLRSLRGHYVLINVQCEVKKEIVLGRLITAGRDYVQLLYKGKATFILIDKIVSIEAQEPDTECAIDHTQQLLDIDGCERRLLVMNFGKVVSGNPFLLNLFFGIPLDIALLSFLSCPIQVKTTEGDSITGVLTDSGEGHLWVQLDPAGPTSSMTKIKFDRICHIAVTSPHNAKRAGI